MSYRGLGTDPIPGAQPQYDTKTYAGYSYAVPNSAIKSLLLAAMGGLGVSEPIGAGWKSGGNLLPAGDTVLMWENESGVVNASEWIADMRKKGFAVLVGNAEAPGLVFPKPDFDRVAVKPVAALLLATESIKLASDLTALPGEKAPLDRAWYVIDDGAVQWKLPDEVTAEGKAEPPYALYLGIGAVVLLGAGYLYSKRSR